MTTGFRQQRRSLKYADGPDNELSPSELTMQAVVRSFSLADTYGFSLGLKTVLSKQHFV